MLLRLSLHVKKDKIRSLKTGRRKNETKTAQKPPLREQPVHVRVKRKGSQIPADSSSCTHSLSCHENIYRYIFSPSFVSPPAEWGQYLHNHFSKCIGGLAGYYLSYKESYESAKEYF